VIVFSLRVDFSGNGVRGGGDICERLCFAVGGVWAEGGQEGVQRMGGNLTWDVFTFGWFCGILALMFFGPQGWL